MIFGTVSLVLGGIFWLLTGVFSQGNSQTAGSLARGWTSLIIVSSIGCGLALKQGWGDHRMLATILVFRSFSLAAPFSINGSGVAGCSASRLKKSRGRAIRGL